MPIQISASIHHSDWTNGTSICQPQQLILKWKIRESGHVNQNILFDSNIPIKWDTLTSKSHRIETIESHTVPELTLTGLNSGTETKAIGRDPLCPGTKARCSIPICDDFCQLSPWLVVSEFQTYS